MSFGISRPLALGATSAVVLVLAACAPIPRPSRAAPPTTLQEAGKSSVADDSRKAAPGQEVPPGLSVEVGLTDLIEAHNRVRREQNLPPLAPAARLDAAARAHSIDMAVHQKMTHEGSDGSDVAERVKRQDYPYQKVGENVAEGYRSVEAVVEGWMNSKGHRENILGDFTEIGTARATSADDQPYWTVVFATPWPKLDPETAARDLVAQLNKRREADNKPPLRLNPKLQAAAQEHAQANVAQGALSRKESGGASALDLVRQAGYRYQRLSQIDASGVATPDEAVSTWMDQRQYRSTLLGEFTETGVGYATTESGTPYWTILLARPLPRR